ncbi:hypothetical protein [Butyrivibrio sp. YAB3001]|uniref:hypothetical protein n=1 Tax=Butyrivibrio sp. YAB3001 TaxID=1520812 RepID=UPI0008F66799|nr:hypothetical protein [Butyrivibrio sp. YAB3001]SFC75191.1 hypothetical protein SAMN02910398_03073 [Butyrivibrio sp. YAB3001]
MFEEQEKLKFSPIVLFVYKRLDHVTRVVEALRRNPEAKDSILYIYSDAPAKEEDKEGVWQVRDYIKKIEGFADVIIIERDKNWGIEKSEIDGISSVLKKHETIIVIEDDIEVSDQFLKYMNYCLSEYKNNKGIYTITGYSFLKSLPEYDGKYGLTRSFAAWGWGTWRDRWQNFKHELTKEDLKFVMHHKKKLDNGEDFSYLLMHQYKEDSLTWDVMWYYSCFFNGGRTLFPYNTLVNNIGMDGSGVHYNGESDKNRIEAINERKEIVFPLLIKDINDTASILVKEKQNLDKKSFIKAIKMTMRFWLDGLCLVLFGEKSRKI